MACRRAALAEKLQIDPLYVQTLEGARCPNVKVDIIEVLAKAVEAKPEDFFEP